jgi:RimJ/RimL family protein N-acetyltransferase
MTFILETDRLILRELSERDLEFTASILGDAEVMRAWERVFSRDESAQWIHRQRERYERDGCGYWLAVERRTHRPIGQAGLMMMQIDGAIEPGLGYIIHRPYWKRGYATEAGRGVLADAFDRRRLERVIAAIRPDNAASVAVAGRLGMQPEKRTMYGGFEHLVFVATRAASRRIQADPPASRRTMAPDVD